MYRTFLSTIALFCLATWVTAQTPYGQQTTQPSTSQSQTQGTMPSAQSTGTAGTTITGCLSGPNAEGAYELKTDGRTVEVGRTDELKAHVGHQVALTGNWAKAGSKTGEAGGAAQPTESGAGTLPEKGESTSGGGKQAGERHFTVTNVTMVSDTCKK
jgi:hypothetical protein